MKKCFSLTELAQLTSSKLIGNKDHVISNVNSLEKASSSDASFLANDRYVESMRKSQAGVICVNETIERTSNNNYLISEDPSYTFQLISELLLNTNDALSGFEGIHSTATIHKSAKIGNNVTLGPFVVVDKNANIDDDSYIAPFSYIGKDVQIGKNSIIHPSVTINQNCFIGNRVILQAGCVIGSCGFGYVPNEKGEYTKLKQLGNVIIEDDVEIGANTTIDRARFKSTIIKKGTKIDNLVQIAHNVEIGEHTAIAAQTGIAGSAKVGSKVLMGGQVGVTGHVVIDDFVMLATRSGVSKSLKPGKYRGSPAIDLMKFNRQEASLRLLPKKIKYLEDKIKQLENLLNLKK
jgi:UDP-3-O-[3-hydroxymyristoyl] glucosamine N-acyltransferase